MSQKIDICYERQLTPMEVSTLVERFLAQNPKDFETWVELERTGNGIELIWDKIIGFIKSQCKYNSMTDINKTLLDMRGVFHNMSLQSKNGKN